MTITVLRETVVITRFLSKISIAENDCWEWMGGIGSRGYGGFWNGRKVVYAHRFAYEMIKGGIPEELEIDHLCRNHSCVNPNHLEAVLHRENCNRGVASEVNRNRQLAITHCPQGHPYNKQNTYICPSGKRHCRICRRVADKRFRSHGRIKHNRLVAEGRLKNGNSME